MNNLTNFTTTVKEECPKGWEALRYYLGNNECPHFEVESLVDYSPPITNVSFLTIEGYLRGYLREKFLFFKEEYFSTELGSYDMAVWEMGSNICISVGHDTDYETAFLTACLEAFKYLEK